MFYAGIDWADQKHDGLVLDETGRKLGSIRVAHTPEGLAKLDAWLAQLLGEQSRDQMACIIETNHGLLIAFLLAQAGRSTPSIHAQLIESVAPLEPKRMSLMRICSPRQGEQILRICTG